MKNKTPFLLGLAAVGALTVPAVQAQNTAVTDPVGYITNNAFAAAGTTPVISLLAPTLLNAPDYIGAIASINATTITVDGDPWQDGQFTTGGVWYVEITSAEDGAVVGRYTDISANTAGSLTVMDDISTDVVPGDTITIRKHITLDSFLGADNAAGLGGGAGAAVADEVTLFDAVSQSSQTFFYVEINGVPPQWVNTSFQPAGSTVIAPNQGLIVKRKVATDAEFVTVGHVKVETARLPVHPGLNVIGVPNAVGTTLDGSNLAASLTGGPGAANADTVTVFDPGGTSRTYFYFVLEGAPSQWVNTSFQPSGDVALAEGTSILISRAEGTTDWVAPAPTIAE